MSSRKTATAKKNGAHGAKHRTSTRPEPASAAAKPVVAATETIATAEKLAAEIQRALAAGNLEVLSPEALQKLMTAACRLYSAQAENGSTMLPVGEVTPTDIMVTASGLMRAGNLAVFELGMWQSWTGR